MWYNNSVDVNNSLKYPIEGNQGEKPPQIALY